ncbi:unnamed protein product [Polarella glacialis]|uniref:Carrier domain-containing protein n=1 Tax=Polarella glacialis TaxID=89957 RepID=A0A813I6H3_POLGL|nr:unnamed protein product [Polarella glacialis]
MIAKECISCRQCSPATASKQSILMPVVNGLAQKDDLPRHPLRKRDSEHRTWHPMPVQPISSARPVEPTGPIRARLRLCISNKLHSCHLGSWEASGNVLVQQLLVLPSLSRPPCSRGARASSTVFVLPSRVLLSLACLQNPWFSFVAAGSYKGCPVQVPQVPARALNSASAAPTSLWPASPKVSRSPEAISNNSTMAARLGGGLASGGLPVLLSVPLHVEVEVEPLPKHEEEEVRRNYSSALAKGEGGLLRGGAKLQAVGAGATSLLVQATRCSLQIIAAAICTEAQVLPPQLLVQTVERRRLQSQPLKAAWPSFCGGFALSSLAFGCRPEVKLQVTPIREPGRAMKQSRQLCCSSHAVKAVQPRGNTSIGILTPCHGRCELIMSPFFDVASAATALAPVELGCAMRPVRTSLLSSTLETCTGQVALRLASLGKADAASSYLAVTCPSTPETDSAAQQHNQSHMKRSVGSNGLSIVCKQALTAHRYLDLQNKLPPVDSASASGCSGSATSHNQGCTARSPVCFCSCLPVAADLVSSTSATSPRSPVRVLTRRLLPCLPCDNSSPGMLHGRSAGQPFPALSLSSDDRLAVLLAGPLERLEANSTVLFRAASHACANWHATTSILIASKPSWRKQAWIPPFLSCLARATLPESTCMPPLTGQSQAASSPPDGNCKVRCTVVRCPGVTHASLPHVKASCLFAQFARMAPSCNEVFCDRALMSASSEPMNSLHRFEPVPVRGARLHSLDEVLSPREGPSICCDNDNNNRAIHGSRLLRLHALTRPISSRGCSHFFQESAWKLPVRMRPRPRASTHHTSSAVSSWMPWRPQQSMKGTGCNAPSVHQLCGLLRSKAPKFACLDNLCRRSTPGWRSLADCVSNSVVRQDLGCTRLESNTAVLLAWLVFKYCSMDQLELGLCCSTSDGKCAVRSSSATSTPGLDSWVSKMSKPSGSRTCLFCLPPLSGRVARSSRASRSQSVCGRFTSSLSSASAHQCARPVPILCFRGHNSNIFSLLQEHFRKVGSTASAAPAVTLLCPLQNSFDGFLHRNTREWSHHASTLVPPTKNSLSTKHDPIGHASLLRRRPFATHCGGAVVCTWSPNLAPLVVLGTSRDVHTAYLLLSRALCCSAAALNRSAACDFGSNFSLAALQTIRSPSLATLPSSRINSTLGEADNSSARWTLPHVHCAKLSALACLLGTVLSDQSPKEGMQRLGRSQGLHVGYRPTCRPLLVRAEEFRSPPATDSLCAAGVTLRAKQQAIQCQQGSSAPAIGKMEATVSASFLSQLSLHAEGIPAFLLRSLNRSSAFSLGGAAQVGAYLEEGVSPMAVFVAALASLATARVGRLGAAQMSRVAQNPSEVVELATSISKWQRAAAGRATGVGRPGLCSPTGSAGPGRGLGSTAFTEFLRPPPRLSPACLNLNSFPGASLAGIFASLPLPRALAAAFPSCRFPAPRHLAQVNFALTPGGGPLQPAWELLPWLRHQSQVAGLPRCLPTTAKSAGAAPKIALLTKQSQLALQRALSRELAPSPACVSEVMDDMPTIDCLSFGSETHAEEQVALVSKQAAALPVGLLTAVTPEAGWWSLLQQRPHSRRRSDWARNSLVQLKIWTLPKSIAKRTRCELRDDAVTHHAALHNQYGGLEVTASASCQILHPQVPQAAGGFPQLTHASFFVQYRAALRSPHPSPSAFEGGVTLAGLQAAPQEASSRKTQDFQLLRNQVVGSGFLAVRADAKGGLLHHNYCLPLCRPCPFPSASAVRANMVVARACPRTCHDAQALLPKSFQGANSLDSVSSSVAAHRGSCCSHLASLRCMSSKEGHTSKAELPTRQLWLSNCLRHGQVSTSTQKQRHGCKPTSCAQYDALLRHIRPAAVRAFAVAHPTCQSRSVSQRWPQTVNFCGLAARASLKKCALTPTRRPLCQRTGAQKHCRSCKISSLVPQSCATKLVSPRSSDSVRRLNLSCRGCHTSFSTRPREIVAHLTRRAAFLAFARQTRRPRPVTCTGLQPWQQRQNTGSSHVAASCNCRLAEVTTFTAISQRLLVDWQANKCLQQVSLGPCLESAASSLRSFQLLKTCNLGHRCPKAQRQSFAWISQVRRDCVISNYFGLVRTSTLCRSPLCNYPKLALRSARNLKRRFDFADLPGSVLGRGARNDQCRSFVEQRPGPPVRWLVEGFASPAPADSARRVRIPRLRSGLGLLGHLAAASGATDLCDVPFLTLEVGARLCGSFGATARFERLPARSLVPRSSVFLHFDATATGACSNMNFWRRGARTESRNRESGCCCRSIACLKPAVAAMRGGQQTRITVAEKSSCTGARCWIPATWMLASEVVPLLKQLVSEGLHTAFAPSTTSALYLCPVPVPPLAARGCPASRKQRRASCALPSFVCLDKVCGHVQPHRGLWAAVCGWGPAGPTCPRAALSVIRTWACQFPLRSSPPRSNGAASQQLCSVTCFKVSRNFSRHFRLRAPAPHGTTTRTTARKSLLPCLGVSCRQGAAGQALTRTGRPMNNNMQRQNLGRCFMRPAAKQLRAATYSSSTLADTSLPAQSLVFALRLDGQAFLSVAAACSAANPAVLQQLEVLPSAIASKNCPGSCFQMSRRVAHRRRPSEALVLGILGCRRVASDPLRRTGHLILLAHRALGGGFPAVAAVRHQPWCQFESPEVFSACLAAQLQRHGPPGGHTGSASQQCCLCSGLTTKRVSRSWLACARLLEAPWGHFGQLDSCCCDKGLLASHGEKPSCCERQVEGATMPSVCIVRKTILRSMCIATSCAGSDRVVLQCKTLHLHRLAGRLPAGHQIGGARSTSLLRNRRVLCTSLVLPIGLAGSEVQESRLCPPSVSDFARLAPFLAFSKTLMPPQRPPAWEAAAVEDGLGPWLSRPYLSTSRNHRIVEACLPFRIQRDQNLRTFASHPRSQSLGPSAPSLFFSSAGAVCAPTAYYQLGSFHAGTICRQGFQTLLLPVPAGTLTSLPGSSLHMAGPKRLEQLPVEEVKEHCPPPNAARIHHMACELLTCEVLRDGGCPRMAAVRLHMGQHGSCRLGRLGRRAATGHQGRRGVAMAPGILTTQFASRRTSAAASEISRVAWDGDATSTRDSINEPCSCSEMSAVWQKMVQREALAAADIKLCAPASLAGGWMTVKRPVHLAATAPQEGGSGVPAAACSTQTFCHSRSRLEAGGNAGKRGAAGLAVYTSALRQRRGALPVKPGRLRPNLGETTSQANLVGHRNLRFVEELGNPCQDLYTVTLKEAVKPLPTAVPVPVTDSRAASNAGRQLLRDAPAVVVKAAPRMDLAQIQAMLRDLALSAADDDDITDDTPLMDSAMSSLSAVAFRNELATKVGLALPATLLLDYPSLSTISIHLQELFEEEVANESPQASTQQAGESMLPESDVHVGTAASFSLRPGADDWPDGGPPGNFLMHDSGPHAGAALAPRNMTRQSLGTALFAAASLGAGEGLQDVRPLSRPSQGFSSALPCGRASSALPPAPLPVEISASSGHTIRPLRLGSCGLLQAPLASTDIFKFRGADCAGRHPCFVERRSSASCGTAMASALSESTNAMNLGFELSESTNDVNLGFAWRVSFCSQGRESREVGNSHTGMSTRLANCRAGEPSNSHALSVARPAFAAMFLLPSSAPRACATCIPLPGMSDSNGQGMESVIDALRQFLSHARASAVCAVAPGYWAQLSSKATHLPAMLRYVAPLNVSGTGSARSQPPPCCIRQPVSVEVTARERRSGAWSETGARNRLALLALRAGHTKPQTTLAANPCAAHVGLPPSSNVDLLCDVAPMDVSRQYVLQRQATTAHQTSHRLRHCNLQLAPLPELGQLTNLKVCHRRCRTMGGAVGMPLQSISHPRPSLKVPLVLKGHTVVSAVGAVPSAGMAVVIACGRFPATSCCGPLSQVVSRHKVLRTAFETATTAAAFLQESSAQQALPEQGVAPWWMGSGPAYEVASVAYAHFAYKNAASQARNQRATSQPGKRALADKVAGGLQPGWCKFAFMFQNLAMSSATVAHDTPQMCQSSSPRLQAGMIVQPSMTPLSRIGCRLTNFSKGGAPCQLRIRDLAVTALAVSIRDHAFPQRVVSKGSGTAPSLPVPFPAASVSRDAAVVQVRIRPRPSAIVIRAVSTFACSSLCGITHLKECRIHAAVQSKAFEPQSMPAARFMNGTAALPLAVTSGRSKTAFAGCRATVACLCRAAVDSDTALVCRDLSHQTLARVAPSTLSCLPAPVLAKDSTQTVPSLLERLGSPAGLSSSSWRVSCGASFRSSSPRVTSPFLFSRPVHRYTHTCVLAQSYSAHARVTPSTQPESPLLHPRFKAGSRTLHSTSSQSFMLLGMRLPKMGSFTELESDMSLSARDSVPLQIVCEAHSSMRAVCNPSLGQHPT